MLNIRVDRGHAREVKEAMQMRQSCALGARISPFLSEFRYDFPSFWGTSKGRGHKADSGGSRKLAHSGGPGVSLSPGQLQAPVRGGRG